MAVHGCLRQVTRELGQQARLALALLLRSLLLRDACQFLADLRELEAAFLQDLRREALLFAQQTQQQVLGPDVFVAQPLGFLGCVGQDALALIG